MAQIRRFGPGQTAKVLGVLYFIMGACFAPVFFLMSQFAPQGQGFPLGLVMAMPFLYGGLGAVFVAIGCVLYNVVAGWVGGIDIDLTPSADM